MKRLTAPSRVTLNQTYCANVRNVWTTLLLFCGGRNQFANLIVCWCCFYCNIAIIVNFKKHFKKKGGGGRGRRRKIEKILQRMCHRS